ncbi:MAG: hypothetical protein FWB78_07600, partial [Treponema sp.]|nr:hypothetical protein [Treponema sp.]
AALIAIANIDTNLHWYRGAVERIVEGLVLNNTALTFCWTYYDDIPGDRVTVGVGDIYEVLIDLDPHTSLFVTWDADANDTTNTTAINFTFARAITGLTEDHITVTGGTGFVTTGDLTGNGASWSLEVTVIRPGDITISINKSGIQSGTETVAVYGGGVNEAGDIIWVAVANSTINTTAINFAFGAGLAELGADDITVTAGTGTVTVGTLTGAGTSWSLEVIVTSLGDGNISVSIDRGGIEYSTKTVEVFRAPVTWAASTNDAATTTTIDFIFDGPVPDLTVSDITVADGTGSVTIGALTGSGIQRSLAITIIRPGTVYVSIGRSGIQSGPILHPTVVITAVMVPGITLTDQLSWLRGFAASGNHYFVEISGNESISVANAALPTGRSNVTITLIGSTQSAISGTFAVPSGVTLVLDENIDITSSGRGVTVNSGGTLIMNEGARIIGNTLFTSGSTLQGGGILVNTGGTFIMNGGEISDNTVSSSTSSAITVISQGGGVFIANGGVFTMNDGIISGNQATATRISGTSGNITAQGGGVHVATGGMFNMNGGEMSDNQSTATRTGGSGGTITSQGGGLHVASGGTFRISNGIVYGNEATVPMDRRNTSGDGLSASLSNAGTAQRGTFNAVGVFTSLSGLSTTNITINVLNGNLQW